ncbi:uncharacterized protein LOC142312041 [Anomaloglossus baeobatrachus]|uniref:uncharacterized protein LOC142312041 n=1 Tax=Anomaloglossus baeobatrachus TaxID=238106 RepID=UPI003F501A2F
MTSTLRTYSEVRATAVDVLRRPEHRGNVEKMDKDIANKEEMHFAADIVALDDQDYSDEIMEETLFEVPENEHEIKTFMYETWKNISMETAVYYWMEDEDYTDDYDKEDNEDYPDEMKDMNIYPDEMEDIDDYPDDMEDIYNYPDEMEDMNDFLDEIWKKTVMETEIYFWPIDFGSVTSLPTLETIPEEDEEEDGFEGDNRDSQDIGHCEMDTDKESGYDNISEWKKTVMETEIYFWPIDFGKLTSLPTLETILEEDEEEDGFEDYNGDSQDIGYSEMDTDIESGYDNISEWKKTVMETEIYFWPIDFGKYKFSPTLETIPEEDEEEDEFEDYNRDSQDIGYSEMDTDTESGYDNISEMEDQDYMDDNDTEDNEEYPDEMEDMDNYPDEMEDIDDYPDDMEDIDNYPDEMKDMDDFLDEIWKKTVMNTEIYFWPIDFGKLTLLPTLETIPEEDEEEDGFEDYNGDSQDIGHCEMDTDKESGYDNISGANNYYSRLCNYPDKMEDISNYPDEMEDIYNYPDEVEDMDNYPDEMEDMDDFLDEIWKKTVTETEIYFRPIDFGDFTFRTTLETILEEEEKVIEEGDEERQNMGRVKMKTQADKDELENASRSYRQWRRLLRFFRETFSCCCSIQTSE